MGAILQRLAALHRIPFDDQGQKLDLAYVTPNIIVTSMPTTDYLRSWYRTSAQSLKQFLIHRHANNWQLWNFRAEVSGDYHDRVFDHQVVRMPFPDHQSPPFDLIVNAVQSIDRFLKLDPHNVAVLHCEAGQGRSGTIACAYLMIHQGYTLDKAIAHFTCCRMRWWYGKGVTIKSQLRYLGYIERWINEGKVDRPAKQSPSIQLLRVRLWNPTRDDIRIECRDLPLHGTYGNARPVYHLMPRDVTDAWMVDSTRVVEYRPSATRAVVLYADFGLVFDTPLSKQTHLLRSRSSLWINANFEMTPGSSVGTFVANWSELDGLYGTAARGFRSFNKMEVMWRNLGDSSNLDE